MCAAGLQASSRNTTSAADPGSAQDQLAFLLEQLDYVSSYTGKNGRSNGGGGSGNARKKKTRSAYCLYDCDDIDTSASSAQTAAAYLAASPAAYDSRSSWLGKSLLTPVKNQGDCGTCVAVAIVATGEAALASALNISGSEVQSAYNFLSDYSYYCLPDEVGARSCKSGWDIVQALDGFPQQSLSFFVSDVPSCITNEDKNLQRLLTDMDTLGAACNRIKTCQKQLEDSSQALRAAPVFIERALADGIWMIQQHIRQHGSAITQLKLTADFIEFFKSNPKGVYNSSLQAAEPGRTELHAINLVGYNNTGMYWIARNSWGRDWAEGGYFRMTYDSYKFSNIGVGDYTYGLIYSKPRTSTGGLQVPAVEADPDKAGCFLYNVPAAGGNTPELYLSQIADLFRLGLKLPELIQNNTARGLFEFSDEEQQYIDLVRDWGDGQHLCRAAGGYLATIKSPEDAEVVRQLMALTGEYSSYDTWMPGIEIRAIAFMGARLYNDGLYRWQDGSGDIVGAAIWGPGHPGGRVASIVAINEQNSKVYLGDWQWGWLNYQIGAICQIPVLPGVDSNGWPLATPAGLFPKSATVSGGLSSFSPVITVNEDFTVFSFNSEESSKRISLVTSGTQGMTLMDAAKLCQARVPGGNARLFTWDYRQQLEEVGQAMNAVAFRYLTNTIARTKSNVWVNLYQPPGQKVELFWMDRKWYRLPADVSSMVQEDLYKLPEFDDNLVHVPPSCP
eukprot:gene13583-13708_t